MVSGLPYELIDLGDQKIIKRISESAVPGTPTG
jgi:hypothetical protein